MELIRTQRHGSSMMVQPETRIEHGTSWQNQCRLTPFLCPRHCSGSGGHWAGRILKEKRFCCCQFKRKLSDLLVGVSLVDPLELLLQVRGLRNGWMSKYRNKTWKPTRWMEELRYSQIRVSCSTYLISKGDHLLSSLELKNTDLMKFCWVTLPVLRYRIP